MGRDFRGKKISEKVDFLPRGKESPANERSPIVKAYTWLQKTGPGRTATGAQVLSEIGFSEILGCFSR